MYTVDDTTIDNWIVAVNDVIYIYVTLIGSWVAGSDLQLNIEM